MMDSRNNANRSNKPIASELAKGGPTGSNNIRVSKDGDSDEEDDDDILGGGEDLGQSFGKKKGGLEELKAKLSLQEELGALKSELSTFESGEKPTTTDNKAVTMDEVQERDDADDLDDDDDFEADDDD